MYGADLSASSQAVNTKQAFNEMPAEVLNKRSTEISNIVRTPEEKSALRQECASLKKPETVNQTAGNKREFEPVQAKKAKVAPPKVSPHYRIMLKVDGSFRRGDVTHMQAYIELGAIMRDYWGGYGASKSTEIKICRAIMHYLPANYHSYVPVEAEATQLDYIGDWPGTVERQIEKSLVRAAQDEGPPDWVAGPEGNIVAVDDKVAIKIK